MSGRRLPARPSLDHLKHESRALHRAFEQGDAAAMARVTAVLGARTALKLTEAQRVVAREYGFANWARLRAHVQASRGIDDAIDAFLSAVESQDRGRATQVLSAEPRIAKSSLHVAAVLGLEGEVRGLIARNPAAVRERVGSSPADPLLWLCYSPFHGESRERDEGLFACARALLDAGADPGTKDARHGVPALYAVTGVHNVPRIARLLLEAGATPNDGESVFHAAERFHVESLELLREFGADLNLVGEWGNTPLYFLLRYWEVGKMPDMQRGLLWLLEHGADPNVRCGRQQESALHVAVRRRQDLRIIRWLLDHGAEVNAPRGDGRTPWVLARRSGSDAMVKLLEEAGATRQPLTAEDRLVEACARGDEATAALLTSADLVDALDTESLQLLSEAARRDAVSVVRACLTAGFPVDTPDEIGSTALHQASIAGRAAVVRELLRHGADFRIKDREHHSSPLGWACFGADMQIEPEGTYEDTVQALLEAGARPDPGEHLPSHPGVAGVLRAFDTT